MSFLGVSLFGVTVELPLGLSKPLGDSLLGVSLLGVTIVVPLGFSKPLGLVTERGVVMVLLGLVDVPLGFS